MSLLEEAKKSRDRENKVSLNNALKQYLGASPLKTQVKSEIGEDATKLLSAVKEETSSSEDREAPTFNLVAGKVVPGSLLNVVEAAPACKLKRNYKAVKTDPYI